ncbi:hypothetical protein EJC49_17135 [Aquibium carbonis]|uniref:Uncharacterized protein n=1 Tax=Aquibium carbonis TaxID=2495581 RepID=A0A429YUJ6_9HYPH|nr:hypothetical protein [Aquibium carbonis]RST85118.1 hypothetical protein EJC49_17135 [Aquibium carbonis]
MAIGLLAAQQAQAGSFVMLGGEPAASSPSVVMLGRPVARAFPADRQAAPSPDRSIETSALRTTLDESSEAGAAIPPPPDPEPLDVVVWPPVLSRSMMAFGEPRPARPRTVATASRAPFSLPAVFRAGLAGDAFTSTQTPARAAVQEERPLAPSAAAGSAAQPDTPALTERREPQPSRRDRPPAPEAPPSVPATPPPTMRLR